MHLREEPFKDTQVMKEIFFGDCFYQWSEESNQRGLAGSAIANSLPKLNLKNVVQVYIRFKGLTPGHRNFYFEKP